MDMEHENSGSIEKRAGGRTGKGGGGGFAVIPRSVMVIFCYIVPALLVSALIALGVWGSGVRAEAQRAQRTNRAIYTQAYNELTDSVYNMHIALSKLLVSEAPATLTETLDDIWRESGTVAGIMGRIPQNHIDSYELNRFLIQIGDYARSLSTALMRGGRLTEDDRGQLMEVYTASEAVYNELSENLSAGSIPLEAMEAEAFFTSANDAAQGSGSGAARNEDQSGSAADEANKRYPTLIYDGPFSESTEKRQPQGLSGKMQDDGAAMKLARQHLEDEGAALVYEGRAEGRIPFHSFSGSLSDGRYAEAAISVQGGFPLYLRVESGAERSGANTGGAGAGGTSAPYQTGPSGDEARSAETAGEIRVPDPEALSFLEEAGRDWLERHGFGEMEPTYAQYYPQSVLISFAAVKEQRFAIADGGLDRLLINSDAVSGYINELRGLSGLNGEKSLRVLLYSDLVKLWLDRESGEVLCADAENYLFSHAERELPGEILSAEQAAKRLSANLEVQKTALALIPMPNGSERLCHEFTGSFAGSDYIVYLDARSGDEVRVFRLVSDGSGSLAL